MVSSASLSRTILLLLAACILIPITAFSQEEEREYTEFERERFELDLKFEATVLLDDGTKFKLTDFHIGTGLYRHKVETGDSQHGLLMPISNIKRIVRSGNTIDWVDFVFLNDSEMHARWSHYKLQKIYGITEDGAAWEGTIDQVREIVIWQVDKNNS